MNFFYRSRLWAFVWLYILVTYLTLPVMRGVLDYLRESVGADAVGSSLNGILLLGGIILMAFAVRLGWKSILHIIPPLVILLVVSQQLDIPEERFHFFQYGLMGLLVLKTCREHTVGYLVIAATFVTVIGVGDEAIQWLLPNRVGDLRDVGMNALAGVLGVWMGRALFWVRDYNP